MNDYAEWAARYPQAAADLEVMHTALPWPEWQPAPGDSEAWSQQATRLSVARQLSMSWRNNVGATPAKCSDCGTPRQPVRYGLANDSTRLNKKMKSSDLILAIPRLIQPADVGTTIAQFGSVECKRPGWRYTGTEPERAQLNWLTLIRRIGGYASFSTGEIEL